MTTRKKVLATSRTEAADLLNLMDGKFAGLSRAQARLALKHAEAIEMVCILTNKRSVLLALRKSAKRKALRLKAGK